jgi:predicted flavoprotein YhiN
LFYSTPKELSNLGVKVKMNHEVTGLDFNKKQISIVDQDGNILTDNYDKLILALGS